MCSWMDIVCVMIILDQHEELSGGKPPAAKEVMKRLDDVRSRVRYHG